VCRQKSEQMKACLSGETTRVRPLYFSKYHDFGVSVLPCSLTVFHTTFPLFHICRYCLSNRCSVTLYTAFVEPFP
jgi:hypothetical protein